MQSPQLSPGMEEKVGLISQEISPSSPPASVKARTPWVIATVALALLNVILLALLYVSHQITGLDAFETELVDIRSSIRSKLVTFTGSPSFRADGEEYVEPKPGMKAYVGPPSPEIDANWKELTKNRYFFLTVEEARETWGDQYEDFWDPHRGGYLVGLDAFHTLHCLDHIRQSFYPDYYPQTPIHGILHRDRKINITPSTCSQPTNASDCIDHLRQMVMCHADATPIPTRYYAGIDQNYIDSDQQHMCRDFQLVRNWVTKRYEASGLHDQY